MKTVGISDHSHGELKKIAKMHGLSQGEFVEASVQYFKRTGENPGDPRESPKASLEEMNKRLSQVIGFIKAQEQKTLLPLIDNSILINKRVEKLLDDKSLVKINENIKTFAHYLQEEKKEYVSSIGKIQDNLNNNMKVLEGKQDAMFPFFGIMLELMRYQKGLLKDKRKEDELNRRIEKILS